MRLFCYLTLIMGLITTQCYAEYRPPVSTNSTLKVKYDRQAVPSSLVIWDNLSGGYDSTDAQKWARNALVCLSSTDTSNGACRTSPVWWSSGDASDINVPLKFTLDGTGKTVVLVVTAVHIPCRGCTTKYPASNAVINTQINSETLFTYSITQSQLSKLNQPGVWKATLKQNLWQWDPRQYLNSWTANIVLTVTDMNNQQIYFPAFPYSSPKVDLNLSNRPGTGKNSTASGIASLDMCLYDGSNSSSNRVNMTFRDEGASATGRADGLFSVYLNGADKSQASNRLDYQVSVINPTTGASQTISNGSEISWTGTNQRNILRQVVLPGLSNVSLCVPAPIKLTLPVFNLSDKVAGHYTGKLTIIYTPSTQSSIYQ